MEDRWAANRLGFVEVLLDTLAVISYAGISVRPGGGQVGYSAANTKTQHSSFAIEISSLAHLIQCSLHILSTNIFVKVTAISLATPLRCK